MPPFGMSPNCCGDHGHPPPCCCLTIHFGYYGTGAPIEGGVITGPGGAYVGTTDPSGNFTFPTPCGSALFVLAFDGASCSFYSNGCTAWNCANVLDFCFCGASFAITPDAPASLVVDTSPTSLTFFPTTSGSTTTYAFKSLNYCGYPAAFPLPLSVRVLAIPDDPDTYLANCISFALHCGDDLAESIPLFDYGADYARTYYGSGGDCDISCDTWGEGPNHRGLTPKTLYITWSAATSGVGTLPAGIDVSSTYFGSWAHVAIPIVHDPASGSWLSACLDGGGTTCDPGNPYSTRAYHSLRTGFETRVGGVLPPLRTFFFTFHGDHDCGVTPPAPDECGVGGVAFVAGYCGVGGSPVDYAESSGGESGVVFTAHITE